VELRFLGVFHSLSHALFPLSLWERVRARDELTKNPPSLSTEMAGFVVSDQTVSTFNE
jgi:hypothetical protein